MVSTKRWIWGLLLSGLFAVGCGSPVCGNGEVEDGEQCDLGAENANTGTCTTACLNARCGDGFVQGNEGCDDGNLIDTDGCRNTCTLPNTCGNNVVDAASEACDGTDLNNQDCVDRGFDSGTLGCLADCTNFDVTGCISDTCGNGQLDLGEVCDGLNLDGEDCQTQGFDAGSLSCNATCTALVTTGCADFICGNDIAEGGEECDGADLSGEDCATHDPSFIGGTLGCIAAGQGNECSFDTSACILDQCGNGVLDANTPNEVCDGFDLGGEDCASLGLLNGSLACNADCGFDTIGCILPTCGNGALDAGEACDAANLNNQSCVSQGFASGTLACNNTCQTFNTLGCVPSVCGNTIVETGEACDDGNQVNGDGCENDCSLTGGVQITTCQVLPPLANGDTCAVTAGSGAKLITGDILTPGQVFKGGQVLVDAAGIIQCTACDCSAQAGASTATQITCPTGVVSPGLINTHDHITFTQNQPYTQTPERYEQRHDWRKGIRGHSKIPAAGQANQDQIRWGELRFLMGGTTSSASEGSAPGFIRNLDSASQDGLGQPQPQTETFPLDDNGGAQRNGDCNYGGSPDTAASIANRDSYIGHVSEGIDAVARNEFLCLSSTTFDAIAPGVSDDLVGPKSAFTHSIGFKASDYAQMAQDGTAVVWSPRSNITLYGDTAMVTEAAQLGVLISLGTDWVPTGSMNTLRELQCADQLNSIYYNNFFSDEDLWLMATLNSAVATATDDVIGLLAPNKVADISIFNGAVHQLHRAVIDAEAQDVVLVMRGGKVLYGDAAVISTVPNSGSCDVVDVCGESKRLCATGDIGKSLAALQAATPGLYPAFFCGLPTNEPSCVPTRSNTPGFPNGAVNGSNLYTGIPNANDNDGDGINNSTDNCADIFNPIRPVDNGAQADFDSDGVGDACDVCPLDANTTTCTTFNPNDSDSDGVNNINDNCPNDANTDQADGDTDGKGDVCDACPAISNPGNQACPSQPATIYAIKDGTVPIGTAVLVTDGLVTGKGTNGFFMQVKETDAGYLGPNFSGIFVFTNTSTLDDAVLVGNRVTVDGSTLSFQGQIEITNPTAITITNAGVEAAPAPIPVTIDQVTTNGPLADELESVIVEVANATVTVPFNTFFEYEITDATTAKMLVDDFLFLPAAPAVNDFFQLTRGVLALRTIGGGVSASKIHPRSAADLIPGIALVSFAPDGAFLNIGDVNQPTFPTALTASLNLPAEADTFVTITSSDPNLVVVEGGGVTILTGQTSAVVNLTALGLGTVTLTATSGAATLTADVNVIDPAQTPVLTTLAPGVSNIASGGNITFTVSLDLPAQGNTIITLALNPAGAGTIPATVTIPDGQTTAIFGYTDNGSVVDSLIQVSATLDANTLTADITATVVTVQPTLLFSEYVEGSSNNKALEIINHFTTPFDLAANSCAVDRFSNGGTTATVINLTGTIQPEDVFVICNNQAGAALSPLCDATNAGINFNGDDAVQLRCGTTVFDIIGQIGFDPGTVWGVAPNSTLDNTLRRRCSVATGDIDGTDAFDPIAADWLGLPIDTFDGLGDPTCAP